jgi:hypothetical protein
MILQRNLLPPSSGLNKEDPGSSKTSVIFIVLIQCDTQNTAENTNRSP